MGRRASQQSTLSKGEMDPDLSERWDLEHYYDSAASAPNTRFHPQGGASDRGGFELCSDPAVIASDVERRRRRRIVPHSITAEMVTAANGGDAEAIVDRANVTVFETNAVTSDAFVIFEVDLGQALRVDFVDIMKFKSELAGADEALSIEYWDGAAWQVFADAIGVPAGKHIRTTERSRRFGTTPGGPHGFPVVARQWRAILRNADGVGQVTINHIKMWYEVDALTPIDVIEVARDNALSYDLIVSERNCDVLLAGRYVASIPLHLAGQQIEKITTAGGFDTLIVFHEMLETLKIERQGSDGEWDLAPVDYAAMPLLQPNVIFSGDRDEVQEVDLAGLQAGDKLIFFYGDGCSPPVTYVNEAGLPALIANGMRALPAVVRGVDHIEATIVAPGPVVRIHYKGDNANRSHQLLTVMNLRTEVVPDTVVVQAGFARTDARYCSASSGWPRCGAIVQQRMMLGGFRAAPTSYRFSRYGNIFNFGPQEEPEPGEVFPDQGFGGALDVREAEVINHIFVGRDLQLLTEAGEWFASATKLDATAPIGFARATGHGSEQGVEPVMLEGLTLFLQKGGRTLRTLEYSDQVASYDAPPLNLLCPHLLTGGIAVARRPARNVTEGNIVFAVNGSGTMVAITVLRDQQVIAGSAWSTDGKILAVSVNNRHELRIMVERGGDRYFETWTPDMPLDFATRLSGLPRTIVSGCGHLEGRDDVWAIADGDIYGPLSVVGGSFQLPVAASDIVYGLEPPWRIKLQPVREKLANAQPFRAPGRIYEVELAVKRTGSLTIAANGGPHIPVPLTRMGSEFQDGGPLQTEDGGNPQLPLMERLYTGNVGLQGLLGFTKHPFIEIGRSVPAPVHIKSIRYEVAHKGDD